jgi:hypothetical protein
MTSRQAYGWHRTDSCSPVGARATVTEYPQTSPQVSSKAVEMWTICCAQNARFSQRQALSGPGRRVRLVLHRARSVSRPKQLAGAVGGSRKFPGDVDESATGSVNFFGPAPLEHAARTPISCCPPRSFRKLHASRFAPPCTSQVRALGSLLHRARSASRSKQLPRAVGGSRRFTGDVDKSATGSVNFFWSNAELQPRVPRCR